MSQGSAKNLATISGVTVTGTPSTGQVLTATSAANADWQTPGSGFTAGGDLSGTSTSQKVIGVDGYTISGTPTSGQVLQYNGTNLVWVTPSSSPTTYTTNGFRLTLTSGTAVTTADVTGAGTLYCTPMFSGQIALFVSSVWTIVTSAEFSLALTLTSGSNYDVFVYSNAGTATLELSSPWSSDISRNDPLTQQDGVWVKLSDASRRYVGTIRATGTNTTEDSVLNRFVYNFYNQQPRSLLVTDNTTFWAYTTAAWREARGQTTNNWSYIVGMPYERLTVDVLACESASNGTGVMSVGVGIDSSTVNSAVIYGSGGQNLGGLPTTANYKGTPGLGYHNIVWIEWGAGGGQFYGNVNSQGAQIAGMSGEIMG